MRIRLTSKQREAMLQRVPVLIQNIQIITKWCQSIQRKRPLGAVVPPPNAIWALLAVARFPAVAASQIVGSIRAIAQLRLVAHRRNRRSGQVSPRIAVASLIQVRRDNPQMLSTA